MEERCRGEACWGCKNCRNMEIPQYGDSSWYQPMERPPAPNPPRRPRYAVRRRMKSPDEFCFSVFYGDNEIAKFWNHSDARKFADLMNAREGNP